MQCGRQAAEKGAAPREIQFRESTYTKRRLIVAAAKVEDRWGRKHRFLE
jgi:hypothetical protein